METIAKRAASRTLLFAHMIRHCCSRNTKVPWSSLALPSVVGSGPMNDSSAFCPLAI